jgi:hypothetical protein
MEVTVEADVEKEDEVTTEDRQGDLDTWLLDKGQYMSRGYAERSDRWYDIPRDFLCIKESRDRFNL